MAIVGSKIFPYTFVHIQQFHIQQLNDCNYYTGAVKYQIHLGPPQTTYRKFLTQINYLLDQNNLSFKLQISVRTSYLCLVAVFHLPHSSAVLHTNEHKRTGKGQQLLFLSFSIWKQYRRTTPHWRFGGWVQFDLAKITQ